MSDCKNVHDKAALLRRQLVDLQSAVGKMAACVPQDGEPSKRITGGLSATSQQMIQEVTDVLRKYAPRIQVSFGDAVVSENRRHVTCVWTEGE